MIVIGIAGGTGSGKSTVVSRIVESLPEGAVALLPQDNYYRDLSHLPIEQRRKVNFDEPRSIEWTLLESQLETLREARAVEMPTYSYLTCTRQAATVRVEPRKVVIVEGILVLTEPRLRDMLDIKVFVEAVADTG